MADDTLFARVGGQPWFDALVDAFYTGVEPDPVLRPLYPDDLEELFEKRSEMLQAVEAVTP